MTYSARPFSTNLLQELVNQANAFTIGQIIIFNGSSYVLAQADSLVHCAGSMIVTLAPDANSFYATQTGYFYNPNGTYNPGFQYYLDAITPGALNLTAPSGTGQVILPCFVADTATSGYFYGGSGNIIESGSLFTWTPVTGPTSLAVNNGYVTNSASGNITLTMPSSASIGDLIRITNISSMGNFIVQAVGAQVIQLGNMATSAAGSITAASIGDGLDILCVGADLFQVIGDIGQGFSIA